MKTKAWYSLLYGQIWLYLWLGIAALVRPAGLWTNSGVSYYGTFLATVAPYTIALLGVAYWNWRASAQLTSLMWLGRWLRVISICLIGIVITPYTLGRIFDDTHTTLGAILFMIQLIVSGWIAFRTHRRLTTIGLWSIELAAGIVSAIYVYRPDGYLIESQIVFQLAFGAILLIALAPRSSLGEHTRP